jgi:hypothetical protein
MIDIVNGNAHETIAQELHHRGIIQDRLTDDQTVASGETEGIAGVDIEEDRLALAGGFLAGRGQARRPVRMSSQPGPTARPNA